MKKYIRFLIVWAVNSSLIFLANSLYPANFVLGNWWLSRINAGIFAGFLLTLFCKISKPFVQKVGLKLAGRSKMFLFYLVVNFVSIWLIARISPVSGFGISAFYYGLGLAVVATLVQWLVRQIFKASKLLKA